MTVVRTRELAVDDIVRQIGTRFSTFGQGSVSMGSPIDEWMKDKPLVFALGVDVRAVVEFVLQQEDAQPSTLSAVGQR